jgi:hypothetical protein
LAAGQLAVRRPCARPVPAAPPPVACDLLPVRALVNTADERSAGESTMLLPIQFTAGLLSIAARTALGLRAIPVVRVLLVMFYWLARVRIKRRHAPAIAEPAR